jgi:hypothetical protein
MLSGDDGGVFRAIGIGRWPPIEQTIIRYCSNRAVDWRSRYGSGRSQSRGCTPAMKFTPVLFVFALIAANIPSLAEAQTKSSTPPPPPLTKSSVARGKGMRAIPPPPPISSIKTPHKRHASSAHKMAANQAPGRDMSGRRDMSARSTGFYPVTKGVDTVDPKRQQSAIKPGKRRY